MTRHPHPTRRGILHTATLAAAAGATALPRIGSARAQTQALDSVNIISAAGNLTTVFDELMHQQNFFTKFGLAPKLLSVSDGQKLMGGILTGQMDICPLAGFAQIFPAVLRGASLKLTNGGVLLGEQTVFTAKPNIHSVKDLAGKTIGVGSLGAQLHQTMVALLLAKGVDPGSVTFANIGSSADVFRAVVAKVVDAGPAQIDVIPSAPKLGVHMIDGGDMWSSIPQYPFQGGFASDQAIAAKRDLLTRTLAAYASLFRFLSGPNSHDAFMSARRKALGKSDAEFEASSEYQWNFFQKVQPFALDLLIPPERIAFLQNLNVRLNVQTKLLPPDKVVDTSLAKAAMALVLKV